MADNNTQNQDINGLLQIRRDKLADLVEKGKNPFEITKYDVTHHTSDVKELYTAHENELLAGRPEPDVEGLDEQQKRETLKADYNAKREIMDASPIDVTIAGRMMFKRVMGKASFIELQDSKGRIQVYITRDDICPEENKEMYNTVFKRLLDLGDFIGIEGFVFRTQMGEISIHAKKLTVLSKSIKPLPIVKYKDGVAYDSFEDPELRMLIWP